MKFAWLFLGLGLGLSPARAELNVVASIPDFGALARTVGGDHVRVTSLAKGTEDAHFVDARPSFIRLLNRADVLIEGGAELEAGWLPTLVNAARNGKIQGNARGRIVLGPYIRLAGVPAGPVDRSQGDVHPLGNPHFWLDPENGKIIARVLAERFSELEPSHKGYFQENLARFSKELDSKVTGWQEALAPNRGTKVVTYHQSFDYFLNRFGFELVGTIESKPGIEPSASYINSLIQRLQGVGVKLIVVEPYRPRRIPDYLAQAIGATLLVLPDKVEGVPAVKDFIGLFDYNVAQTASTLKEVP